MTIGSIPPVAPILLTDRTAPTATFDKLRADVPAPRAPFDPAPALRPTLQDQIAIDRTLMALREL